MNKFFGRRAALAMTLGAIARPVLAQSGSTARVIVPYPPGGTSDWLARIMVQKLNEKWKTSTIVENRPGGDTQIGTLAVVRSKADGLTMLFSSVSIGTVNKVTAPHIAYDAPRDLIPTAMVAQGPALLLVSPSLGVNTFAEFIELARKSDGRLAFSTASSTGLIYGEIFKRAMNIKALPIPYKGSAPAAFAVAKGEVAYTWESIPTAMGLVDGGKVKVLMTTAPQRLELLPDVPTANELGHPELNPIGGWWGFFLPAGTPPDIVNRLNSTVNEIIAPDDIRKQFRDHGVAASPMSPQEFGRFMASEYERHLTTSKLLKG